MDVLKRYLDQRRRFPKAARIQKVVYLMVNFLVSFAVVVFYPGPVN